MTNECVYIGLRENITSLKSLSLKAYHSLSGYAVPSCYKLCAISRAVGILRNYRRAIKKGQSPKVPYVRRLVLATCYGFKVEGDRLRLPIKAYDYDYIDLNQHTLEVLSGPDLTTRSVCMTERTISITFSKETAQIEPVGLIGLDRNLDNVTAASSDGKIEVIDLSKATRIKVTYKDVKSHFKRDDVRIRRKVYGKYGRKEKNKVSQILHLVSKSIASQAKEKKFGIVMEELTGIRKLYRKGNGQGANYRFKLNSWSYAELQRQIDYKARWEGLPVIYVRPQKTSSTCAICGSKVTECAERKVWCPECRTLVDRDENAAKNVLARGLRFGPIALPVEAVKGNEPMAPILGVDGGELTQRGVK